MALVNIPAFVLRGFPSPQALDADFPGHVEVHVTSEELPAVFSAVIVFMQYRGTKSNPVHLPNKEDALDQ